MKRGTDKRKPSEKPIGLRPRVSREKNELADGLKFGKVEVVGCAGVMISTRETWYECRCSCGKLVYFSRSSLCNNRGKDRACEDCFTNVMGKEHGQWRGYEEISGQLWRSYELRAAKREIPWKLDIAEAWKLFVAQDCKCALTGLPLQFSPNTTESVRGNASLDRIDSLGPYSVENVQWVHKIINKMKNDLPQEEFVAFCTAVSEHEQERRVKEDLCGNLR